MLQWHLNEESFSFLFWEVVLKLKVYNKEVGEIDFPLSFILCLNDRENISARYSKFGYTHYANFYRGINMYNTSVVGWKGHMENGSVYGSVQGNKN